MQIKTECIENCQFAVAAMFQLVYSKKPLIVLELIGACQRLLS
jgi:hypothetical protein